MSHAVSPTTPSLARLLSALRTWGITYLTAPSSDGIPGQHQPLFAKELLTALAQADDPRVRDATVSLLLLHPDLASVAAEIIARARRQHRPDLAEQLITRALAALYLQRMWAWQLTIVLPQRQPIAEAPFAAHWHARHLPAPACDFGESGLRRLAAYERQRTSSGANFAGDWLNQIHHLLRQEWARQWDAHAQPARPRATPAWLSAAPTPTGDGQTTLEEDLTSLRPDVSRDQIEQFLREFGALVHQPGRVYLVGGAALVHGNVRGTGATTVGIDLRLAVTDEHEAETAIRELVTHLGVNVELAYPGDFIPVPSDWEARSRYVGRYGALDVFYFDFTTSALAKIARGTDRDLRDVGLLAQQSLITRDELDAGMREILPQLGHGRFFNVDPQRFTQHYEATTAQLWAAPS